MASPPENREHKVFDVRSGPSEEAIPDDNVSSRGLISDEDEPTAPDLTDFNAEGLESIEALLVATAATSARLDSVRRADPDFAKSQLDLQHIIAKSPSILEPETMWTDVVMAESVDGISRSGLIGGAGFVGDSGSYEEEKFAVRVALTVLSGTNPKVLADAMGAALSTLYSYSDTDRPNRPGQKRLYQAAYLFSRFANEMRSTAEYLTEVARRSSPSRASQSDTLPRISGKKFRKKGPKRNQLDE